MIRTALAAAAVAALAFGWGCSQSPGDLTARGRSPAARLAQLEDELAGLKSAQAKLAADSAAAAASLKAEQARAAALAVSLKAEQASGSALADGLKAERAKAAGLAKERDDLRAGVAARQAERDAARARLDGFRQELRELLGRVEGPVPAVAPATLGSTGF